MPRFEEYMQLFPQRQRLQEALLKIYCGYLDFCVSAVNFFSVNIIGTLSTSIQVMLGVHWMQSLTAMSKLLQHPVHFSRSFFFSGFLTAKFKDLIERIEIASRDFVEEAKLAHVVDTKFQLTDIREVLDIDKPQRYVASVLSVPWARNGKFLGREQELERLAQCLRPGGTMQRSCVLHGMAGIGKTQTALEFCYAQKSMFPYIIWLPSETEAVLAEAFSKIRQLTKGSSIEKETSIDTSSDVDASRQWLCQSRRHLSSFVDCTC